MRTRTLEAYGKHYTMAWPFEEHAQRPAAAPLAALRPAAGRRAPCFGEKLGWERPNWFAGPGEEPVDVYSFGRAELVRGGRRASTGACRERVALFDQTSFAKFLLVGRDAEARAVLDLRQRRARSRRAA